MKSRWNWKVLVYLAIDFISNFTSRDWFQFRIRKIDVSTNVVNRQKLGFDDVRRIPGLDHSSGHAWAHDDFATNVCPINAIVNDVIRNANRLVNQVGTVNDQRVLVVLGNIHGANFLCSGEQKGCRWISVIGYASLTLVKTISILTFTIMRTNIIVAFLKQNDKNITNEPKQGNKNFFANLSTCEQTGGRDWHSSTSIQIDSSFIWYPSSQRQVPFELGVCWQYWFSEHWSIEQESWQCPFSSSPFSQSFLPSQTLNKIRLFMYLITKIKTVVSLPLSNPDTSWKIQHHNWNHFYNFRLCQYYCKCNEFRQIRLDSRIFHHKANAWEDLRIRILCSVENPILLKR